MSYKVAFLFGAGASHGAGGISPSAPPLGADLFDVLVRRYPNAWGALEQSVARRFQKEGFEAGMGWIWQNMRQAPQVLQKCVGHFFCEFCVGDANANAYARLLRGDLQKPGRERHDLIYCGVGRGRDRMVGRLDFSMSRSG